MKFLEKRSLRLGNHRTSVALEPAFWAAVEEAAKLSRLSIPRYIVAIDAARPSAQSLASALRCAVLAQTRVKEAAR